MKSIAKKILLSVAVGGMGLTSSICASSLQEEGTEKKKRLSLQYIDEVASLEKVLQKIAESEAHYWGRLKATPAFQSIAMAEFQQKKGELLAKLAAYISPQEIEEYESRKVALQRQEVNEPIPMSPDDSIIEDYLQKLKSSASHNQPSDVSGNNRSTAFLEASSSSDDSVIIEENTKERKLLKKHRKSTKRTHSIKGSEALKERNEGEFPKAARQRAPSTSKKSTVSEQSEKSLFEQLLPSSKASSSASVHFDPQEGTLIEDDQQELVMEVNFPSSYLQAPTSLTHDEVKRLLIIPLVSKTLDLGPNSTLSGMVVTKKQELQGGLASHKLPEKGIQRITDILDEYPGAIARLLDDEKRSIHTLSTQGYKGVIGHYNLVHLLENGKMEALNHSNFTIAFAKKK